MASWSSRGVLLALLNQAKYYKDGKVDVSRLHHGVYTMMVTEYQGNFF